MFSEKANLIQQSVALGRAVDILALMEGESPYTTQASTGAPTDRTLGRLWVGALHHLRFIAEFGTEGRTQVRNGRVESPLPEAFEQWLAADAPGIGMSDLADYLRNNPLPG